MVDGRRKMKKTLFAGRMIKTHLCALTPGGCIKPAKTLYILPDGETAFQFCEHIHQAVNEGSVGGVWVDRLKLRLSREERSLAG